MWISFAVLLVFLAGYTAAEEVYRCGFEAGPCDGLKAADWETGRRLVPHDRLGSGYLSLRPGQTTPHSANLTTPLVQSIQFDSSQNDAAYICFSFSYYLRGGATTRLTLINHVTTPVPHDLVVWVESGVAGVSTWARASVTVQDVKGWSPEESFLSFTLKADTAVLMPDAVAVDDIIISTGNCTKPCADGLVPCGGGPCIPAAWVCDGEADCPHGTDENHCDSQCSRGQLHLCGGAECLDVGFMCDRTPDCPQQQDERQCGKFCGENEMLCPSDNTCIPRASACDGVMDCTDRFDESPALCNRRCPPSHFRCDHGLRCLDRAFLCDGSADCEDGTDEITCDWTPPQPVPPPDGCGENYHTCAEPVLCIPARRRCDGRKHCLGNDLSDEQGCNGVTCAPGYSPCPPPSADQRCIPERYFCDGDGDCDGYTDELNCIFTCGADQFRCLTKKCVPQTLVCNGRNDCGLYEDEKNCPGCPARMWRCADGVQCIKDLERCDGMRIQCDDRSDEQGCTGPCRADQFQCSLGGCIPDAYRCDGRDHCLDGSDEWSCDTCRQGETPCKGVYGMNICLKPGNVCDGFTQCQDQHDEQNCAATCPPLGRQLCQDGRKCVWQKELCDGVPQCYDGSDEGDVCTGRACTAAELDCGQYCLRNDSSWICDNQFHCSGMVDEKNCSCDATTHFRCDNGRCVHKDKLCDKINNCGDWSDESTAKHGCSCSEEEFDCGDGHCIAGTKRCDRIFNCLNKRDEINCKTPGQPDSVFQCPDTSEWFRCGTASSTTGRCVSPMFRCDGVRDCDLGEDELNCGTCDSTEFQCRNYTCLPLDQQCDGRVDCDEDGLDENLCVTVSPTGGPVQMKAAGVADRPVCADSIDQEVADALCFYAGYRSAATYTTVTMTLAPHLVLNSSNVIDLTQPANAMFTEGQCSTGRLSLTCTNFDGGSIASARFRPRIINGDESDDTYRWMVSISAPGYPHMCGGVLISSSWVLTAAHCIPNSVKEASWKQYSIVVSSGNRASPVAVRRIRQRIVNPDYISETYPKFKYLNDLCLVELESPLPPHPAITTLLVPLAATEPRYYRRCVAAGWGYFQLHRVGPIPYEMREVRLVPRPIQDCYDPNVVADDNAHICTKTPPVYNTCGGDSGGPLMCEDDHSHWWSVGITSFGLRSCEGGTGAWFTKTSSYIDWIRNVTDSAL